MPYLYATFSSSLPPFRNSDPGSHSRHCCPPLYPARHAFVFYREKTYFEHFLPSIRVELCVHTLCRRFLRQQKKKKRSSPGGGLELAKSTSELPSTRFTTINTPPPSLPPPLYKHAFILNSYRAEGSAFPPLVNLHRISQTHAIALSATRKKHIKCFFGTSRDLNPGSHTLLYHEGTYCSNQDLIWCIKIGVYMGFWVHRGSSLLISYAPP